MTDFRDDELDELASALLDGTATGAEELVAEEPEVVARIAEFEAVARAIAVPVDPPSDAHREAAIAAALGTADQWGAVDDGDDVAPPPRPAFGAPRRDGARRWYPAIAAVAASILALAGIVALGNNDSGNDAPTDVAGLAEDDASRDGEESATLNAPAADAAGGTGGFAALTADLGALGVFGSVDDLTAAALDAAAAPVTEQAATTTIAGRGGADESSALCPPLLDGEDSGVYSSRVGTAVLDDVDVVVAVIEHLSEGMRIVRIFDAVTCELVDERSG